MSHSPAPRRRPSAGLTRRAVGVLAAAAVVFSAGATAAQSSTNYLPKKLALLFRNANVLVVWPFRHEQDRQAKTAKEQIWKPIQEQIGGHRH